MRPTPLPGPHPRQHHRQHHGETVGPHHRGRRLRVQRPKRPPIQDPRRLIGSSLAQRASDPQKSLGEGGGPQRPPERPLTPIVGWDVRSYTPRYWAVLTGLSEALSDPYAYTLPPTRYRGTPHGPQRPPRGTASRALLGTSTPEERSADDADPVVTEGSDNHAQKVKPPETEGSTRRPPVFSAKPQPKILRGEGGSVPSEPSDGMASIEEGRARITDLPTSDPSDAHTYLPPCWGRIVLATLAVAALLVVLAYV